ncbi:AAA family ATPase [Solemya velum gill symbiont]|nr:AAA family ATPase [Solemya velum gill symbiont]OOZ50752.1 AAA family ATPase [Solemya velum gill symbiont]OOZ65460.1 AAA family ATPase [Solemya velum gill symbiont]OOZ68060.1 AAA family ATPase [Solemya velum gill symbiont]OOZ75163.1 AAA family ATPase [Solemya velum gill symbiont]
MIYRLIKADGHLLVTGGPGSGKTTISILKGAHIAESALLPGEKVLFLSFARASVSRVIEAIEYEQKIPSEQKQQIDVQTYHSFFWRILKAHGYLIGLPRQLTVLTPPAEAIALSAIRTRYSPASKLSDDDKTAKRGEENEERQRLAMQEGRVCFDLFAPYVSELLHRSERLRRLLATMYPVIILDEFQDTNEPQWHVVQALGIFGRLIALADPEQRIYDFIGANPERLNHFRDASAPTEINFSTENHRSAGTEIVDFGNDVLAGKFQKKNYKGIELGVFDPFLGTAMTKLVTMTYAARSRLVATNKPDWSLAILVPTKKMTRLVSDMFREPPAGMQSIQHTAVIELEAAILGAELIAHLMQPNNDGQHFDTFVGLLSNYFLGKGGDQPTKGALKEAARIHDAYEKWHYAIAIGKAPHAKSIIQALSAVYQEAISIIFTGDPDKDWLAVRTALEIGDCPRLKEVGNEVRNIRLLERGSQLRQELTQEWRDNGDYENALAIVRKAFIQEHFATGGKPETGIVVMNMHKAKGKQFDEVIIFEGWPRRKRGKIVANFDRIVRNNDREEVNSGIRQNFRVSVTRGRSQTTILTPKDDPCVLLL